MTNDTDVTLNATTTLVGYAQLDNTSEHHVCGAAYYDELTRQLDVRGYKATTRHNPDEPMIATIPIGVIGNNYLVDIAIVDKSSKCIFSLLQLKRELGLSMETLFQK